MPLLADDRAAGIRVFHIHVLQIKYKNSRLVLRHIDCTLGRQGLTRLDDLALALAVLGGREEVDRGHGRGIACLLLLLPDLALFERECRQKLTLGLVQLRQVQHLFEVGGVQAGGKAEQLGQPLHFLLVLGLHEVMEVRMPEHLVGGQPALDVEHQYLADEVYHEGLGLVDLEQSLPACWLYIWQIELAVEFIRVGVDVMAGRRADDLHDLDELLDGAVAGEEGLLGQELHQDAPGRPHVDLQPVHVVLEQQLGRPVVPGADVAHILLHVLEELGRAEVADPELQGLLLDEDVGGLDVAMAYFLLLRYSART